MTIATRSPLELVESKLGTPSVRGIPRTALVNRLRASRSRPVVTLSAPAGYGKTTALAQWALRDDRAFAWVTLDERDNDPFLLLAYVVEELRRVVAVDEAVVESLADRAPSIWSALVPRLIAALARVQTPLVLVLDDVHVLRAEDCLEVIGALVEALPGGCTIALAGRNLTGLRLAKLRAEARLVEFTTDELAFSRREAQLLLQELSLEVPDTDAARLVHQAEGWPAGVYLSGLELGKPQRAGAPMLVGRDSWFVADYFRTEHLATLPAVDLEFLTLTSVLDRMCGRLCDAILERSDSTGRLRSLADSNLFVVPLDRRGHWYRYHRMFKEELSAELVQREPDVVADLHRRAAEWLAANGDLEAAIEHATAAGDRDELVRLLLAAAFPAYEGGRIAAVEDWLLRLDADDRARHPEIAFLTAWMYALRGRPLHAEQALDDLIDAPGGRLSDGTRSIGPLLGVLRAALCAGGPGQMALDADEAVRGLARASRWRPAAVFLRGVAALLEGDEERADENFAEAAQLAEMLGATNTRVLALAESAALATQRGDPATADELARWARAQSGDLRLGDHVTAALEAAVSARAELRRGDRDAAIRDLGTAERLRPQLSHALPWYAVQTLVQLARGHLALLDVSRAEAALVQARQILRRRPALGVLVGQLEAVEDELQPDGLRPYAESCGELDVRRAPPVAAACHAPLVSRDRRTALHLTEHGQDGGHLDLPKVRCIEPHRGCRASSRPGARRGVGRTFLAPGTQGGLTPQAFASRRGGCRKLSDVAARVVHQLVRLGSVRSGARLERRHLAAYSRPGRPKENDISPSARSPSRRPERR